MKDDRPAPEARRAFEELNALRLAVEERLACAVLSLKRYADDVSGGFFHQLTDPGAPGRLPGKDNKPGDPSRASTATCAAFLVAAGRWAGDDEAPWTGKAGLLAQTLASQPWESADLKVGNPFTVSFLLEALHDLDQAQAQEEAAQQGHGQAASRPGHGEAEPAVTDGVPAALPEDASDPAAADSTGAQAATAPPESGPDAEPAPESPPWEHALFWLSRLRTDLLSDDPPEKSPGGLHIEDFPETAFLTYKAVRVLRLWGRLDEQVKSAASGFAWGQLYRESVGVAAGTPDADVFELAYAALTVVATVAPTHMTPRERNALRHAVDQFFQAQDDKGHWPRSRELFRYPNLGNAYCYEYELLVQMLSEPDLAPLLEDKMGRLTRAFDALEADAIPLGDDGEAGWSSGHLNPSVTAPESWTTASGYHFCHEFRRFVVDAIRREVFAYARAPLPKSGTGRRAATPGTPPATVKIDERKFLDSDVDSEHRLRGLLETAFLTPVRDARYRVEQGHGLGKRVPNSMILYGPPGTSKTELAKIVAEVLGWPLLQLDPSHLTRDGLDRLHAETNLLFTMLASAERVVVLLDEFDELVQDRDLSGVESGSRFLTTAMLPKIAELASRRRIVYILATNHIERFDDAISRAGRFDLVVPVMPPRLDEKLRRWPKVGAAIATAFNSSTGLSDHLSEVLEDLTYLEFEQFASKVSDGMSAGALSNLIEETGAHATLRKPLGPVDGGASPLTWRSRVEKEAGRNRLQHG